MRMQSSVFRLQAENVFELPLDFATRAQPDPLNRWQATPGYSAPDVKDRNGSVSQMRAKHRVVPAKNPTRGLIQKKTGNRNSLTPVVNEQSGIKTLKKGLTYCAYDAGPPDQLHRWPTWPKLPVRGRHRRHHHWQSVWL